MPIDEVFIRPLIQSVHFQATFPQLFSIDAKIGDFQSTIMREFPESALLLKQHFMLIQRVGNPESGNAELPKEPADSQQVWQFKNTSGVTVEVSKGSLTISSVSHKTYRHEDSENKFRNVIQLVCDNFFATVRIPLIHRIGLRYINDCPLSHKTTEHYRSYYNGALPGERFPLEDTRRMEVTATVKRDTAKIRCIEKLEPKPEPKDSEFHIILDLDAWFDRIDSAEILPKADLLHTVISSEFEAFAKPDLLEYMRGNGESP